MSCMAAALNSCATLVSMDIVKRVRPDTPDARVVTIGRITTGVIMVLAMLWSTQGDQFGTIFEAINKIPMTFAPGGDDGVRARRAVEARHEAGRRWPRSTPARSSASSTSWPTCRAIGRLVLGSRAPESFAGLVTDPAVGLGIPFMLVGPLLAVVCVVIYVVTSLLTPAMDAREVAKVCWDHPLAFLRAG